MSDDDFESSRLSSHERELFAALPREMGVDPNAEQRLVAALRSEGLFQRRTAARYLRRIAAAAALVIAGALAGGLIGGRMTSRASLEGMLARNDLPIADRILLLQRAGSAYVRAAHAYADATAKADSTAVEVARQVLLGAAHAVVRNELDTGLAASLTSMLQQPVMRQAARPTPSVIWY